MNEGKFGLDCVGVMASGVTLPFAAADVSWLDGNDNSGKSGFGSAEGIMARSDAYAVVSSTCRVSNEL